MQRTAKRLPCLLAAGLRIGVFAVLVTATVAPLCAQMVAQVEVD
jgi:hypothetical protein